MVQESRKREPPNLGIVEQSIKGLKLLGSLMLDMRVPLRYKLLPIGAVLWAIFPDFIPGPLDDIGLLYWAPRYFVNELCQARCPDVYRQHYDRIYPEEAAWELQVLKEERERRAKKQNGEL